MGDFIVLVINIKAVNLIITVVRNFAHYTEFERT